jgi:hypothetical protein
VAQQRQDETSRMGTAGLMRFLKDELKLRNDDQARTAASKYRAAIDAITRAAQLRFDLDTQLMSRLRGAGLGLNSKVWIIFNTRTTSEDANIRDNFFLTGLPGELREGLRGTDEERALLGAWRQIHPGTEPPPPVTVELNRRLDANPGAAAEYLQKAETDDNRREEISMLVTSKLTMEDKLPTAFAFIGRLADPLDKENCYRLAASLATQKGLAEVVWKQVGKVTEQTEKVSLCRGLIGGLLAPAPDSSGKK